MDEKTLAFANKLAGVWETVDKETVWFFDKPDRAKYPYWTFRIKQVPIEEFIEHDIMFHRVADVYRLEFNGLLDKIIYVLSFWEDDILEAKTRIDNTETSEIFHRRKIGNEDFFKV